MNKHNLSNRFVDPARVAVVLCALVALGGRAAQAQATFVTSPSQLGNTFRTDPYPTGIVPSSFFVAAGSNNLTFTATTATLANEGFKSYIADATVGPQFTPGDIIEDTSSRTTNAPTGPLRIDFQNGVTGFGLFAQDFNSDTETFTLTVFNGTTQLSATPFTFGPVDNTSSAGSAVFVGALSNAGPLITSAFISSTSSLASANNDFYFGPVQVKAPVPEASTVVSFGAGVFLCAGLALGAHRRKAGLAVRSAPQTMA